MDSLDPLSQDVLSAFGTGGLSFSQLFPNEGSQRLMSDSDVADDHSVSIRSLERNGRLHETKNLLLHAAKDSGPRPTSVEPAVSEYNSSLKFEMLAGTKAQEQNGQKWVCSISLSKIFVEINHTVSPQFSWQPTSATNMPCMLFIRATPIYTSPDFTKVPVKRCPTHSVPNHPLNSGLDEEMIEHVLRCPRDDAIYEKDPVSGRCSVKIPIQVNDPDFYNMVAGQGETQIDYKFVCQTSCAKGMERRAIHVIFTLENGQGDVYGRRTWGFKICACIKRDMRREELDAKECSSSQDSGKTKLLKKEEQMRLESPEEAIDRCFFDLLNYLPAPRLVEVRRLLAGRFHKWETNDDEKVRALYKKLLKK
nr:PREDICTED: cellular tumor antigen p53-like [Bemisia tabaci]